MKEINGQTFLATLRVNPINNFNSDLSLAIIYDNKKDTHYMSKLCTNEINRKKKFNDFLSCVYTNEFYENEFKILYEYFLDDFELTFGL